MNVAPGTVVADRYEIVDTRGGGQGHVLRARDLRHGRTVALKVRPAADTDRAALLAEAHTLLDLRPHRHLPVAREDFFWDDAYVLAMDWVEGRDLAEVLAEEGPLPRARVILIAAQVADALDHLHRAVPPVVHGDVKPANIRLTPGGEAVLVDLGLVGAGAGAGTPGFCAPEVAGGGEPTPASDVYGLAATAFALVVGHPATAGTAVPLEDPLVDAIRAGLATDPARRPPSASTLVQSMLDASAGALPEGTATFLFTDVQGSTRLWEEQGPAMARALADHDALVAASAAAHGGRLLKSKGEGDSTVSVFTDPVAAVEAAVEIQRTLGSTAAPGALSIRVRMAVHTGAAELRDGDYFGPTLNRTGRLRAIAHGGQIVVSEAVATHVSGHLELVDLGTHRLRDLSRPERVFQVTGPGLAVDFPPLTSLASRLTNLPSQATSFVGRETELERIGELLGLSRLVTLIGAGGSGKTRLALQAGAEALDRNPDGVWLVELAPVASPDLVPNAVAAAVGVTVNPSARAIESVVDALATRRALLIIDNCEHVIDATAAAVDELLAGCPEVRVLATSRERLRISGEAAWPVPVFDIPRSAADAATSDPVRLFADRAAAARPGFTVDDSNVDDVVAICRQVDGIPLAIELAAARVAVLTPADLASRLADRFGVLTGGARTAQPRHRSLRATIDWSHSMLTDAEKVAFRRVAVFRGGWALESAEEVVPGGAIARSEVLDVMSGLVDKSLIAADDHGRYRMLETVREFGLGQLEATGERTEQERRHAEEVTRVAEALWDRRARMDADLVRDLNTETDNLKAALAWTQANDPELAGRLQWATWAWFTAGDRATGVYWADRIGDMTEGMSAMVGCRALVGSSVLVGYGGQTDRAYAWLDRAVATARAEVAGDELAWALWITTALDRLTLKRQASVSHIGEALALAESSRDPMLLGLTLIYASWVAHDGGDEDGCGRLLDRAEALANEHGNLYLLSQVYETRSWDDNAVTDEMRARAKALTADLGIETAGSGGEAWRLLKEGQIDAAITLLEARIGSGEDVHFRVEADLRHSLITAYHLAGRRDDAWALLAVELESPSPDDFSTARLCGLGSIIRRAHGDLPSAEQHALRGIRLMAALPADAYSWGFTPQFGRQVIQAFLYLLALDRATTAPPDHLARLVAAAEAFGPQGAEWFWIVPEVEAARALARSRAEAWEKAQDWAGTITLEDAVRFAVGEV